MADGWVPPTPEQIAAVKAAEAAQKAASDLRHNVAQNGYVLINVPTHNTDNTTTWNVAYYSLNDIVRQLIENAKLEENGGDRSNFA